MAVLITGGLGYIGSHTAVELALAKERVVLLDNLSNSSNSVHGRVQELAGVGMPFYNLDVRDVGGVSGVIEREGVKIVIHFAGLKAVGESVEKPLAYYDNNVAGIIGLLEACVKAGVEGFVFSSSATVYGGNAPFDEEDQTNAASPYGRTKLMAEYILRDLPSLPSTILRYFNPAGAHPSGLIGEAPRGIPNNLMPYICQVASGKLEALRVFGSDYDTPDGSCIRDYIHVQDLAYGHLLAIKNIGKSSCVYNLGTGQGTSVFEMIRAFENATGISIPYTITDRRAGDSPIALAKTEKARKELGFNAGFSIQDMCRHSWNYESKAKEF